MTSLSSEISHDILSKHLHSSIDRIQRVTLFISLYTYIHISKMAGFDSALAPFTLKGFYLCTWGTAVGTNVWQTLVRHHPIYHHYPHPQLSYITHNV